MTAHANELIKFYVGKLVFKIYPQIDFNINFTNEFSIGSFFLFQKEDIPLRKK